MNDWRPKNGDFVFTTPKGVVGFNHLTRLEAVTMADPKLGFVTASWRRFKPNLDSTDDTSIEYDVELEIREAPPKRINDWKLWLVTNERRTVLDQVDWPEFVRTLEAPDVVILHTAVQKIRSRHLTKKVPDPQELAWVYMTIPPPAWCPVGTRYLTQNVDKDFFAVDDKGNRTPVPRLIVEGALRTKLFTLHYEPDPSLEYGAAA